MIEAFGLIFLVVFGIGIWIEISTWLWFNFPSLWLMWFIITVVVEVKVVVQLMTT